MVIYTKMHLLEALKKEGLPWSYKSLLKMERDGVIKRDENTMGIPNRSQRFYSEDEIKDIVNQVRLSKQK